MVNKLTKKSSESEIKAYFTEVLKLAQSNEQFPVNLDDVWPLVYGRKEEAVRALKNNDLFMQGVDYQVFRISAEQKSSLLRKDAEQNEPLFSQNGKQKIRDPRGGSNKETYFISLPCLEFFIARKVRPVFDVYREVFHKVASGAFVAPPKENEIPPIPTIDKDIVSELADPSVIPDQRSTLMPLTNYYHHILCRFMRVVRQSCHNKSIVELLDRFENEYTDIRMTVANLTYVETVLDLEGAGALAPSIDGKEVTV